MTCIQLIKLRSKKLINWSSACVNTGCGIGQILVVDHLFSDSFMGICEA